MNKNLLFILKTVAAIIMLQTLFYKFSAAEESVALFTKLAGKNEAFMRIGTGILELIASVFLFIPKTTWLGALMTIGLMSGAILGHLTKLGIEHNNDGGLLFGSAFFILITGIFVIYEDRKSIPIVGERF